MTRKQSAGLLLYKREKNILKVFLVHPGGPLWKNKDLTAWSVPKGEFTNEEEPLHAAIREFAEETGTLVSGEFMELKPITLKSGKKVFAWALEQDIDAISVRSNNFDLEWPPKSGKYQSFPEVDKVEWFTVDEAKKKINAMQAAFIEELESKLSR